MCISSILIEVYGEIAENLCVRFPMWYTRHRKVVVELSFHDLRHDIAHQTREAGWPLEEVAYYLGHVTKKGTPAIQTTARHTQVSREQVKEKLRYMKGEKLGVNTLVKR